MQLLSALFVAALAATSALAQDTFMQDQSRAFKLQLVSSSQTYNKKYLAACHEGAAIEGLCISSDIASRASTFKFNMTKSDPMPRDGYLSYLLVGGNFKIWEPMDLQYNPGSNVAVPLFEPAESSMTLVRFDKLGYMGISTWIDDRTAPPTHTGKRIVLERWYVCETYVGYDYTTLAWALGEGEPQNPSCVKVRVKRVWV